MNYIKELNAFYDRLETNSLSSSAIALWHALMHINNKAGWIAEFAVAASVLCAKSGLKDSMFKKARNELAQKGYIEFKSRSGNQSAQYKLISLWSQCDRNGVHTGVYNGVHSSDHNGALLLNKTKQNEKNHLLHQSAGETDNPFALFQNEIGPVTDIIRDMMIDWLDGGYAEEPEALLCQAIREAVLHEKRSWAYVNKVLQRCIQQGIRTVAQLEQKKQEFEANKRAKLTPIRGGKSYESGRELDPGLRAELDALSL